MSPTAETAPQSRPFTAEVAQVLELMIHSLYTHREIFLRELLSNASDALDKVRFRALTEKGIVGADEELAITITPDATARTLTIADNGVGMNVEEMVENLGTIARSGTKRFLEGLKQAKGGAKNAPELIGQFGVGFYSSFMVAERVVVESRAAGAERGACWTSDGRGSYTIEEIDRAERGTRIVLELKPAAEDEDPEEFLDAANLEAIVRRWSDFVAYPIRLVADGEEPRTLNSMRPLWTRDKSEIGAEEYIEFYKHLTHDWHEPLETVHFKAEGALEYACLLYLPGERPLDLFDPAAQRGRLALYVKRVFITDDCAELLPPWLRFVRGVVDSADLPLNVSRETLQHNRVLQQIRKRIESKVLDALAHMAEHERAKFERFWNAFGEVLKEGIAMGADVEGRIAGLALYATTRGEERATLAEVAARVPADGAVWVALGSSRALLAASPRLEACRARELEVVLAVDPIDEWVFERTREIGGKPVKHVERDAAELEGDLARERREELEREHRALLEALAARLAGRAADVKLTSLLLDSPAMLLSEGPTPALRRMLERSGHDAPPAKRTLLLNPDHAIFTRLAALHGANVDAPELARYAELLFGQALLASGEELDEPAAFAKALAAALT